MLRSLFSGISGLRAHQTMLDVTGNNIANVNTTGFKSSTVQFQDTLSQMLTTAGAASESTGGTNPAQVGLGVKVAGIATSFTQGSSQMTNKSTDMMIQGDGFFVVRKGDDTYYTRAGSFNFDATGQMTLPGDGALVQGWLATDGVVDTNSELTDLKVTVGQVMAAKQTTDAEYTGNLDADAANGTSLERQITVYDSLGNGRDLTLTFSKSATGWSVGADDGTNTVAASPMTFDTTTGALTSASTLSIGGVTVDLSTMTGFSGVDTAKASTQNGWEAGTLTSFQLGSDGTITGSFSNAQTQVLGRMAIAAFNNPTGLEKAGGSLFRTSANSGLAQVGTPGTGGRGSLTGGYVEMSNVDLSSEFTNLIIAQRGFQANSRIITTSDTVLEELINLKR